MSLKAFHIFFIIVSILFAFGFAIWMMQQGGTMDIVFSVVSALFGVGLVVYGLRFVRKLKNVR